MPLSPSVYATNLDNVATTLATAYTAGQGTLALAAGTGVLFGTPSAAQPVRVTVVNPSALSADGQILVAQRGSVASYRCTSVSGDTLGGVTVESGTDQNFPAGSTVAAFVTATELNQYQSDLNALQSAVGALQSAPASSGANASGTYLVQTSANAPADAQVLASLPTGLLKVTTATGVVSTATAGTDYVAPSGSVTGTASNVTGVVAVANGGTGVSTLTGIPYCGGTTPFTTVTIGSGLSLSGTTLTATGGGGAGGMAVGGAVTGAALDAVLFTDATGSLADYHGFTFNPGVGLQVFGLAVPTGVTLSTATTGGSLAAGTYAYRVSAQDNSGQTLASAEATVAVPAGTATNTVTISWTAVSGALSYNVFGRTAGAELLIASASSPTYTDTGSVTPSGALPTGPHGSAFNLQSWAGQTASPFTIADPTGSSLLSVSTAGVLTIPGASFWTNAANFVLNFGGSIPASATGGNLTAIGSGTLQSSTTGGYCVAIGGSALNQCTTASYNIAVGANALLFTTTGGYNTAVGASALEHVTAGTANVAIGNSAGGGIVTGSDNTFLGNGAGASGDLTQSAAIGNNASVSASSTMVLGSSEHVALGGLTAPVGDAQLSVGVHNASWPGVLVQGAASQTANLIVAETSTGASVFSVSPVGSVTVGNHLDTSGAAPTVAVTSAAGGTTTFGVTGTDVAGRISLTTGTTPGSGTLLTVTYAVPRSAAPRSVLLTPANAATAALSGAQAVWADAAGQTASAFTISAGAALAVSTAYEWAYVVLG